MKNKPRSPFSGNADFGSQPKNPALPQPDSKIGQQTAAQLPLFQNEPSSLTSSVLEKPQEIERKQDVKFNYTQTEIGKIPKEWEVTTIDQIGFVTSGKRLPLGCSLVDAPTPHPYVRVTDMRQGTVSLSEIKFVPESVFPAIKRYRIYCEDIFISVAGTLGIVGKIPKELDGANLTENANKITNIKCSQNFLLHVLMSPLIQETIDSLRTVGAQPKLALSRIRKFIIPLPPLPEQHSIAEALSDVDALLDSLDRLIAKKRNIKQATMQQLLTGKTRLPGFNSEWLKTNLGSLGFFFKGRGIKKDEVVTDGLPCVRYGEIYTHHNDHLRAFNSFITQETAKQSQQIEKGDLLFAGSGETAEEIGKCIAYLWEIKAYAGGDIVILRPSGHSSEFLGYLLNHSSIATQKAKLGQGDAVVHISTRNLASIELFLPPISEQTAIASVLSDMDTEIEALEQRREKTRAIKQGMMQELLTGRTRLV